MTIFISGWSIPLNKCVLSILMLFQTHLTYLLSWNTKKYKNILTNVRAAYFHIKTIKVT